MKLTIGAVLNEFFREREGRSAGMRRRRLQALELRLRDYLEAEGDRILVEADLEILASERQFDSSGAFCRTMRVDDLVFALPGFLERCVVDDVVDARLQLTTIEALMAWLIGSELLDQTGLECVLLDVHAALRRGRSDLRSRAAVHAAQDTTIR